MKGNQQPPYDDEDVLIKLTFIDSYIWSRQPYALDIAAEHVKDLMKHFKEKLEG